MASKINYNNKAPFQTLEEIPDENKVNASDMNEIKQVVNTNADELNTAKEDIENLQSGQGTSNADITSLKNRVSTLETDNSTNKTDINNLKTNNETNKSNIQTLQQDNETNKTDIVNLEENKVDKVEGKGLSTEDFTTELKSKLESLENYDDTEIKEDISNLEAEQTEQNEQIDILLNALPTETQEAENINIKGTIPVKFKEFKVSGNSKQETRSGKNLLKNNLTDTTINGVTFKINEDKSITVNGTATANIIANLVSGQYNDNNADEPLTILDDVTNLRLSGCPTGGSSSTYKLDLYNSDYILLATDFGNGTSVIIPEKNKNISRARIIIYSGATVNNLTFKPMLEKGTTATDYEQYGAMPSPEYPSPIQNVEGDVNVTVTNKNLFTGLVKGISINHTTGEEGKSNKSSASDFIKVNFDTNSGYYLSGLTNTISSYVAFYNKDKKYLGRTGGFEQLFISFSANSFSSKAPDYETIEDKNITFVRITQYVTAVSPGTIDDIDNLQIQLEPGTTATNYVEHQEQTVTFPLSERQKLMQGDYLADDGIHHVRNQRELDGTEYWFVSGICYYISIPDKKLRYELTKGKMLCNYFKETIASNSAEAKIGEFFEAFYSSGNRNVMFNYDNGEGGVDNFKSYLAAQKQAGTPVILEYELAEEEIEAYTPEQQEAYNQLKQLTAYEEETNVYSTNSVRPIFKVTAVKDVNSVITQLNQVLLERS